MTIKQALSTKILDAGVLLAHLLRVDRAYLYAHPEAKIRRTDAARFRSWLRRRARHEPVAYIIGEKQFYGLMFKVNRHTLIPRPETELLVETVLYVIASVAKQSYPDGIASSRTPRNDIKILDVGTGSGAIAITIAKHLQFHSLDHGTRTIVATDTSARALAVARANARRNGVARRIRFVRADLLPPRGQFDVIVANLPYLTTSEWRSAPPDIRLYEPRTALDGGRDGLDVYRRLLSSVIARERSDRSNPIRLILEIGPKQGRAMTKLIKKHFPRARVEIKKDLAGRDRIVIANFEM